MKYEIRTRKKGSDTPWEGYFCARTPEEIVSLASQLPGYELKIQTVGHAIETIEFPWKGPMVRDVLVQTMCMAPSQAPFEFKVYGWEGYANEAIIRWTFDHLIQSFDIDTISVSVGPSGRAEFTVRVVR